MKYGVSNLIAIRAALNCIILTVFAACAYCQNDETSLMLELSPPQGGYTNISQGVHNYDQYAEVTLKATPNPGYQFVYWIGDVDDAASSHTTLYLDSPKIVIAVFEKARFTFTQLEAKAQPSGGGGGLIDSAADYVQHQEDAIGAKRYSRSRPHRPKPEEEEYDVPVPEEHDEIPVPGSGEEFPAPDGNNELPVADDDITENPVVVPEPATITFFLTGMFILAGQRQKRTDIFPKKKKHSYHVL